ncbi:hypothetical protein CK203_032642 [Vitis vinifera]|uniref:Uncharacterized protein n=1 Tax=Vitis vinifera TaxID=29760 RepID=A0A438HXM0_VITVI|nr:hypothetical protein CK203_032642 [Vitis vinifera]
MRNIYCWWLSGSEPVERDNNEESMRARDPNHRIPNWEFLDDDEFQVMPQRQRGGTDSEDDQGEVGEENEEGEDQLEMTKKGIESPSNG